MKPFLAKRRRSGPVAPMGARGISVLARRSPAKRSPFKRRAMTVGSLDMLDPGSGDQSCNIKVAVRVRPENEREMAGSSRNIIEIVDDQMLVFDPKEDSDDFFFHGKKQERRDLNKKVQRDQKFAFDIVFGPNSSNEDVFEGTTKDLIDVVFNGFNCSVFVYGATGSGKTHTMLGKENNPGITLRTVIELYKRMDQLEEDISCEVMISYLEIYNEMVFDLINPGTQLQLREDGKAVNIPGLSRHKPSGPEDLLKLLQFGNGNRTQHPTDANKESSRSHAVFQVYVKQKSRSAGLSADMKMAKLSMIDLAGSERGSVTSSRGAVRFREGANINKSLLALGNCINALADGAKYIPYRNSKLTRLLKDSIGGNCRTVMISNISPSSITYEDTYNTLRYADRAKKIKIRLKENIVSVDFHVAQYAKIVEDLKVEIQALKDKITALEEENLALKNQVDLDIENDKKVDTKSSFNFEEVETLKKKLDYLESRQKDYDNLQERLAAFEREQISHQQQQSIFEPMDDSTLKQLEEHKDVLKRNFKHQSDLYLIDLQKVYHKRKFDRCSAITPSDSLGESGSKKLKKFVSNLEKKKEKIKKKNRQVSQQYLSSEKFFESQGPQIQSEISQIKTQLSNNHLKRILFTMFDEQNRTEELLERSLQQLKKSHLLLLSYGEVSEEMSKDFQNLISRIQCTRVQYRDSNLVETNEDSTEDIIGNVLAGLLDLESGIESNMEEIDSKSLNDTVINESRSAKDVSIVHVAPIESVEAEDDVFDEEEDDQTSAKVWRPPTPIKRFDLSSTQTPPSPKLSTIMLPKVDPVTNLALFPMDEIIADLSPVKLTSDKHGVDSMTNGDSTFCLNDNEPEFDLKSVLAGLNLPSFESRDVKPDIKEESVSDSLSNTFSMSNNATFCVPPEAKEDHHHQRAEPSELLKSLSILKEAASGNATKQVSSGNNAIKQVSSGNNATFCLTIDPIKVESTSFSVLSLVDDLTARNSANNFTNSLSELENSSGHTSIDNSSLPASLDVSLIESSRHLDETVVLENPKHNLNATVTLTKSETAVAPTDTKKVFLAPTTSTRHVDKENNVHLKTSAPIAMVSPMTVPHDPKGKKPLKKYHKIASMTNLRGLMDFKPMSQKPKEPLPSHRQPAGASSALLTPTLSTGPVPTYMLGTTASRIKNRVGGMPATGQPHPPRQRSRSPLGDRSSDLNHPPSSVGDLATSSAVKTHPVGGPHRTLKKSFTTSNLHKFK